MKKKLPFTQEELLETSVIFLKHYDKASWQKLAERFQNIIPEQKIQHFIDEVGRLKHNFEEISNPLVIAKANPVELWTSLESDYPLCTKLAKALLVLPHSTVPLERAFSAIRDFRTPKRNRLATSTLEACLLSYQAFKSEKISITTSMIERYKESLRNMSTRCVIKNSRDNTEMILSFHR